MKNVGDKSIHDTGERMVPAHHKSYMIYGEHIVRYRAVTNLVKNKVVLDIASGSGYGSALLGATARQVYGVDNNLDAITYAQKNYSSKKVKFVPSDGTNIPFSDGFFDVVVSFETIEHIKDYEKFMGEIKRVLKTNGLLILSTPNDIEFAEGNHFHLHEFEQGELEKLVHKYFKYAKSYFQGTWLFNALLDEKDLSNEWEKSIFTLQTAPIKPKRSLYFYMLCSNQPIKQGIESLAAISEHWSHRKYQEHILSMEKRVNNLTNEQNELEKEIYKFNKHFLSLPYRFARKIKRAIIR